MARGEPESRGGPVDRLKGEVGELAGALGSRAVTSLLDKVTGTTGRLNKYVEGGGGPGIMAAVTGAKDMAEGKSPARSALGAGMTGVKEKVAGLFRRGGKGGGKKLKLTNIVESIDVGVPVTLAYNQWTQYNDFPKFTKKVESAETDSGDDEQPRPPAITVFHLGRFRLCPGGAVAWVVAGSELRGADCAGCWSWRICPCGGGADLLADARLLVGVHRCWEGRAARHWLRPARTRRASGRIRRR